MNDIKRLIKKSLDKIENSDVCGCYQCKSIFKKVEVKKYHGKYPICPKCGIDSVIGESSLEMKITKEILEEMNEEMF